MRHQHSILSVLAFVALLAIASRPATACNVPVFRYALERWPADAYELVVLHKGPLTDEQQALVKELDDQESYGAYYVRTVDLSDKPDEPDTALGKDLTSDQLPWLVVRYPSSYPDDPSALVGPFSKKTFDGLFDSPTRREVARRILKGDSIVWLLIESGDAEKDAKAKKRLDKQLVVMSEELKLPELTEEDAQYMDAEAGPKLRIAFTSLTVSRSDPKERLFLKILDARSPDDLDKSQPMAFAFFGRGRALGPLLGEELVEDVVADACVFLTGPCSCQIKNQNPGFDMLMTVDWEGVIQGEFTLAEALPRLTTAAVVAATGNALEKTLGAPVASSFPSVSSSSTTEVNGVSSADTTPASSLVVGSRYSFLRTVGSVVAIGIVLVFLGGMIVSRRQTGPSKGSS